MFAARSQSTDSAYSFYPLHVGDVWEYHWGNYIANPPLHLYYQKTEITGDTLMQNGLRYFAVKVTNVDQATSYVSFQRIDSADGYVHQWYDSTHEPAVVLLNLRSMAAKPDTILGIPTQERKSGMVDASVTLAYGFGIVAQTESGSGWPYRSVIIYARVNGTQFGTPLSVESPRPNPTQFLLCQNFPNPFNPTTTIRFNLANSTYVTLKMFDVLGRELRTLAAGNLNPGMHEFIFNASGLPSGIYFYQIHTKQFTATKAMVLAK